MNQESREYMPPPSEDTIGKIFSKLDSLTGDVGFVRTKVGVIETKLDGIEKSKMDEVEVIKYVDKGLREHKQDCRDGKEPSGLISLPRHVATPAPGPVTADSPNSRNSNTIRINLSGLPQTVKWIIFALAAAGGGGGAVHGFHSIFGN